MTHKFSLDRFESAPAMLLAGIRRHHSMSEAHVSVRQQWTDFRELDLEAPPEAPLIGAYCSMSAGGFEYLTGVEVAAFDDLPSGLGRMRLPVQRYAVFSHRGPVSEIVNTWQSIWSDWLPTSGYEDAQTPPFELFNAGSGEGGIEIWFPIRARERELTGAPVPLCG